MTPDTMTILAIDTALGRGSVALVRGDTCLAEQTEDNPRALAERLVPMIDTALAEARLTYNALDRIGVVTGPGTFTGLRIGVATARGLMLASGVPAWGITSLEALATTYAPLAHTGEHLIVAQDARRGELFVQIFDPASRPVVPVNAPSAIKVDAADSYLTTALRQGAALVVGSATDLIANMADDISGTIRTAPQTTHIDMVALAQYTAAQPPTSDAPPRPFYLRAPDAKLPGGKTLSTVPGTGAAA